MSQPDLVFAERFENELETSQTEDSAFGRKTSKSHDWFGGKAADMTPVIETKHAALGEYKQSPSERNLKTIRVARRKAQQTTRRCTNKYWTEHSETIQTAAITGNIRGLYNGIKTGPVQNKMASNPPLGMSSQTRGNR